MVAACVDLSVFRFNIEWIGKTQHVLFLGKWAFPPHYKRKEEEGEWWICECRPQMGHGFH